MAEKDWAASLKNEDRIIANSDRRFRYHCYSLESMSEELTYKERSIYIQDDFTEQLMVEDFIDTVRNEKLAYGLRRLTDRQRFAIELAFWEGYQYKEIAVIFGCSPAAITLLLQRAFHRLRSQIIQQAIIKRFPFDMFPALIPLPFLLLSAFLVNAVDFK